MRGHKGAGSRGRSSDSPNGEREASDGELDDRKTSNVSETGGDQREKTENIGGEGRHWSGMNAGARGGPGKEIRVESRWLSGYLILTVALQHLTATAP